MKKITLAILLMTASTITLADMDSDMAQAIREFGAVMGAAGMAGEDAQKKAFQDPALYQAMERNEISNKCQKWAEINYSKKDQHKAREYCESENRTR